MFEAAIAAVETSLPTCVEARRIAARRWSRVSYAVAAMVDGGHDLVLQARSGSVPWRQQPDWEDLSAPPASRRVTSRRDWVFRVREDSNLPWPYPAIGRVPDPATLRGPLIFVAFHTGALAALGGFLGRLPGEVLLFRQGLGGQFMNMTCIDSLALDEWGRAKAVKAAADCLRRGGFVFNAIDGPGNPRIDIPVLGHRTSVSAGTFSLARLVRAPTIPIAARWRGTRLQIELGEPIAPGPAPAMAAAVGQWLGAYLLARPREREWALNPSTRALGSSTPAATRRSSS